MQVSVFILRFHRPHLAFGPLEANHLGVINGDEGINGFPELANSGETCPAQRLSSQQAEPDFHLIEPRGVRGGEVQIHLRMLAEPALLLGFMSIEIIHNHVQLALRIGCTTSFI